MDLETPFEIDDLVVSEGEQKKHFRGWLSYAFASEVFLIVSVILFLPICLEQLARSNGFLAPEHNVPCSVPGSGDANLPKDAADDSRCVVKLGWMWIDTASYSLYVYSISVAMQALTVISMGGIANHPLRRKQILLLFAAIGSLCATLFLVIPSTSGLWVLSAPLTMIANVALGVSIVAANAYLPSLARESKEVVKALVDLNAAVSVQNSDNRLELDSEREDDGEQPLLGPEQSEQVSALKTNYETVLSRATSRISSFGVALGYSAGITMLIVALVPVTLMHGSTFSLKLAIGLSGIWWAVFTLPAAAWLPRGDKFIELEGVVSKLEWRHEIWQAWKHLGHMLKSTEIKRLQNTFWYLAAWFLLSDAFTTISSTAILFAKTRLHMPPSSLIVIGALAPTAGIAGSLICPILQRQYQWSNKGILVTLLFLLSLIPLWGCLGVIPYFRDGHAPFGGFTNPNEMFVMAVFYGVLYGAFVAYARAFYADLIPPGDEARWYGLFSITDKSSSFIGPLAVGLIADVTGNIRFAFFFIVVMIWLAVPLLLRVDVHKGREDAYKCRRQSSG